MLTPAQRTMRARIAAYSRWSAEDPKANAVRGQAGLRAKFSRDARKQFPELDDAAIERYAEAAYKAHFSKLALKSSKARTDRPPP